MVKNFYQKYIYYFQLSIKLSRFNYFSLTTLSSKNIMYFFVAMVMENNMEFRHPLLFVQFFLCLYSSSCASCTLSRVQHLCVIVDVPPGWNPLNAVGSRRQHSRRSLTENVVKMLQKNYF